MSTKRLTTSDCYLRFYALKYLLLKQPLWTIHGISKINFDCFTIGESNQLKISREIMRYQGYFLKITLRTRLILGDIGQSTR